MLNKGQNARGKGRPQHTQRSHHGPEAVPAATAVPAVPAAPLLPAPSACTLCHSTHRTASQTQLPQALSQRNPSHFRTWTITWIKVLQMSLSSTGCWHTKQDFSPCVDSCGFFCLLIRGAKPETFLDGAAQLGLGRGSLEPGLPVGTQGREPTGRGSRKRAGGSLHTQHPQRLRVQERHDGFLREHSRHQGTRRGPFLPTIRGLPTQRTRGPQPRTLAQLLTQTVGDSRNASRL